MALQLLFIGTTELILIAGIALLLFGGKKLPEMMRGLGQGVSGFKKGTRDVVDPINEVKKIVEEADDISPTDTKSPDIDASGQRQS